MQFAMLSSPPGKLFCFSDKTKILAEKQQRKGSSFQHTMEQSTVSDTVCSTKENNMHVTLSDPKNSESTLYI